MSSSQPPDFFETGSITNHYNAEYRPLEALLACIVDGQPALESPPSRQIRIRDAFKALTGEEVDRVDDPSGKHARALHRMAQRKYEEYLSSIKPEFGGTDDDPLAELSDLGLAALACQELKLPESDKDILVRKFQARYGKNDRARAASYALLPLDRLDAFDAIAENKLLADFQIISAILKGYGVELELKNVFWRSLGKESESVPSTD